jgi:hypothetical protein
MSVSSEISQGASQGYCEGADHDQSDQNFVDDESDLDYATENLCLDETSDSDEEPEAVVATIAANSGLTPGMTSMDQPVFVTTNYRVLTLYLLGNTELKSASQALPGLAG